MEDIFAEMEADSATASGVEKLGDDKLSAVSQLAEKLRLQAELVEDIEQSLKDAKNTLYKLRDDTLPTALQELGLTGLTLEDGSKVNSHCRLLTNLDPEQGNSPLGGGHWY